MFSGLDEDEDADAHKDAPDHAYAVEDDADIGRFVNKSVQTISGVKDTQTLICFNAFTPDRGQGLD